MTRDLFFRANLINDFCLRIFSLLFCDRESVLTIIIGFFFYIFSSSVVDIHKIFYIRRIDARCSWLLIKFAYEVRKYIRKFRKWNKKIWFLKEKRKRPTNCDLDVARAPNPRSWKRNWKENRCFYIIIIFNNIILRFFNNSIFSNQLNWFLPLFHFFVIFLKLFVFRFF